MGVCVATILVSGGVFARAQEQPADTILFNGKIFTSDSSLPYAQAVAIRGERIVAVGDAATVKKLAGAQTKQIDLGGRTVIPGINDAHNHVDLHPANEVDVETKSVNPSVAEVNAAITAAVAKAPSRVAGSQHWRHGFWGCFGESRFAGQARAGKSGGAGDVYRARIYFEFGRAEIFRSGGKLEGPAGRALREGFSGKADWHGTRIRGTGHAAVHVEQGFGRGRDDAIAPDVR